MAGKSDGRLNFGSYENEKAHLPPTVTESNSKTGGFEGSDLFDEGYGNLPKGQNMVKKEVRDGNMAKKNAETELNIFKKIKTFIADKEKTDCTNKDIKDLSFLIEAITYISFLSIVTFLCISLYTPSNFETSQLMAGYFLSDDFPSPLNETSAFLDIQSVDDIWYYIENQFLNGIYWNEIFVSDDPSDKTLLNDNRYLGKVRLRMIRVSNTTCSAPDFFISEARECMPLYSKSVEDKEPFGPANSSAFIYTNGDELEDSTDFTTFESYTTYGAGGFVQYLPTDNYEEALEIVQNLKENEWIDTQTRMLFIDFTTYNFRKKVFIALKLYVEITPFDTFTFRTMKSVVVFRYEEFDDYLYLVFEAIFCAFTIFYFIQSMIEFLKKRSYFFDENLNRINFLIVLFSFTYIIVTVKCFVFFYRHVGDLLPKETYFDITEFVDAFRLRCYVLSFLSGTCWMKAYKYSGLNRDTVELGVTFYNAGKDFIGLSFIFMAFVGSFAIFSYIIYAGQCAAFIRYDESLFTLLRIILGQLDDKSMKRSFPLLTPILVISFVVVIFFILQNLFVAVFGNIHEKVLEEGLGDRFILSEFIADKFYRLLRLLKLAKEPKKIEKTTNILEWQETLQKCGYSEREFNASFAKFNIEKYDEISDSIKKMIENDLAKNMPQSRSRIDSETNKNIPESGIIDNQMILTGDMFKCLFQKLDTTKNTVKYTDNDFYFKKEF
uniref:Uncharacterized protein n=1 Tax=Panagrolaimus sp. ES5 TaxID=591445 RepID=A0AC34FIU0_9BILA